MEIAKGLSLSSSDGSCSGTQAAAKLLLSSLCWTERSWFSAPRTARDTSPVRTYSSVADPEHFELDGSGGDRAAGNKRERGAVHGHGYIHDL
jgi:hypothetical protein